MTKGGKTNQKATRCRLVTSQSISTHVTKWYLFRYIEHGTEHGVVRCTNQWVTV